MRDKVLKYLVEHQEEYVSGEELSRVLGITRAGVWKHIESLRQAGYEIESQTRIGHKLIDGPLNEFVLGKGLQTQTVGKRFVVRGKIDSTNDLAKALAKSGAENGTVVIAGSQEGGKGRQGRNWSSPLGGLWMSIVLRPKIQLKDAASYTLLAGVAAASGLIETAGVQVGIKWPNDLLLKGKKLGGILTEVQGEWQGVEYLVIGIGVNINLSPADLPAGEVTSILAETGAKLGLVKVVQSILWHFERLESVMHKVGFAEVLEEWRKLSVCLHCGVLVKEQNSQWSGESMDIAEDGALLVKKSDGQVVKVYSADVSLRSLDNNLDFH